MKRGEIGHWTNIPACTNLLFFAQLVDELLFDYSIPSNRISTLNSHYLCYDAMSAIDGIENHGVPEGTLKPIMEELYSELGKDPVFSEENKPTSYFVKYIDGVVTIAYKASDLKYQESKRTTLALQKVFFEKNSYYEGLQKKIRDSILKNDPDDQQSLFRMTKSLLTELMNNGYTQKYLYMVMNTSFWDSKAKIDSPDRIDAFFDSFDFQRHEYSVVFKAKKSRANRIVKYVDEMEIKNEMEIKCSSKAGKDFLQKHSNEGFIELKIKAEDPYAASDLAKIIVENNMAVLRLYDHEYKYKVSRTPCGVFDNDGGFYKGDSRIQAVRHKKMPSNKRIAEGMEVSSKAIRTVVEGGYIQDLISLLNAIRFHSNSLDSYSEENQLLDLWAIFETVLDVSNQHTVDRITQITKLLVPLLKKKYVYSLFEQLAEDIKNYDPDLLTRITNGSTDIKEIVQSVCEFVLLESKDADRRSELGRIEDFPLLKERINYYHEKLSTPKSVYDFVEKHAARVRWQVSRIYRNRNLIIHNGESMPYLNLLIENLHSYVDDFLDHIIHSFVNGNNTESMYQEIFISECKWNETFSKSKKSKEPITVDQISEMLTL